MFHQRNDIHKCDVVFGRGTAANSLREESGFRAILLHHSKEYHNSKNSEKPLVVKKIIGDVVNSGGRLFAPVPKFDFKFEIDNGNKMQ